jgi:hypothetical protein
VTETARYRVFVDDNSDPGSRYERGVFDSATAAISACREMIDRDLADLHQPGMSAEELYTRYRFDGRDPFIVPIDGEPEVVFSAWRYAEERAAAICGKVPAPPDDATAQEADDEPSFWTVAAKHPFVMRLSRTTGAEFYNRRTLAWHRWRGPIPPCARMVTRAVAWKWMCSEALGLDFGTVEPPFREWPEPASG